MRLPKFLRRSRSEPVSQADLAKWWGGGESWAGISVDRTGSLGVSAVWACVRLISETLASLPLKLYRRTATGKEVATEHPLYRMMHDSPNPEQTSFLWHEQSQGHLLLQGNHYSQIIYEGGLYPVQLWPLDPERMSVGRLSSGKLQYEYLKPDGQKEILPRSSVLHISGMGWDGIKGYSVIDVHANSIGARIAESRYGAEFFRNGAQPGGVVEMPGKLKDKAARDRFRESWGDTYGVWGKKHSVGILEEGAKFQTISVPPEQAQFIESRKYGVPEIARIFGCPPHMIGDVERSTSWGTGIEEQNIGFGVYTMTPWLVRREQCLNKQLLLPDEQATYYFKYELKGLLRGNLGARTAFYNAMLDRGVFHADDVLELEDMNPQEGGEGKVYFMPVNFQTKDRAINPPEPVAPAPAAPAARETPPVVNVTTAPPVVATQAPQEVNITMPEPVVNLHIEEKPLTRKQFHIIRDKHGDMTTVEQTEEEPEDVG